MTRLFNFPWENHLISKFVAYLRHFPKKFPTHFFQNYQVDQVKGQKCNSSVGNAEGFLFSGVFLVGVCAALKCTFSINSILGQGTDQCSTESNFEISFF